MMIINMLNNLILFRYHPLYMMASLTTNALVSTTKRIKQKPSKHWQTINMVKERYGTHYIMMANTTQPIERLSKRRTAGGYITSRFKYMIVKNYMERVSVFICFILLHIYNWIYILDHALIGMIIIN